MATPAVMNDKALAKFRTKLCERLLASNTCSFADRCQYSHDTSWRRRNPEKYIYSHKRCAKERCSKGLDCSFAHSADEELYHPDIYKTRMCADEQACGGFYCSFAHNARELRNSSGGGTKDQILDTAGAGASLLGGSFRLGFFSKGSTESQCRVKLMAISRKDSQTASEVIRDTRRWQSCPVLAIRRTVATVFAALTVHASSLGKSVSLGRLRLAEQAATDWPLVALAARWARQLADAVATLHSYEITHLCIGPATIEVTINGDLVLGDFLGKVTLLQALEGGWNGDGLKEQAMWYPSEVHQASLSAWPSIDQYAVDSWQLGISLFYMMTASHLYGRLENPAGLCTSIMLGEQCNIELLQHIPLFADLITRMSDFSACRRPPVRSIGRHPVLWSLEETLKFAVPCADAVTGTSVHSKEWIRRRTTEALAHLPHLAPMAAIPPAYAGGWAPELCEEALQGEQDPCAFVQRLVEQKVEEMAGQQPHSQPSTPTHGLTDSTTEGGATPGSPRSSAATAGQQPFRCGSPWDSPLRVEGQDPVPLETAAADQGPVALPTLVSWASFHTLGLEPASGHGAAVTAMPKWIASTHDSISSLPPQVEGRIIAESLPSLPQNWQSFVPFCEGSNQQHLSGGVGASFLSTAPCFSQHPGLGCPTDVSDTFGFSWPPPPPPLPPTLGYPFDPEAQCIPADLFLELTGHAAY